jgi:hypothetical protein
MALVFACVRGADKYDGPVPPKPDIPYLMHANNLVETESGQAREESRKSDAVFVISGAASAARTPMAEPIFIVDARQIEPERIELYRLEVKNGNREATPGSNKRRGSSRALHLSVTPLANHLFRLEANEPLENGEYALTPAGNNRVFCFEVY